MNKAMTFKEPGPVVMKKLLVADAGWNESWSNAYGSYIGQLGMGAPVRPFHSAREATFDDIAKALGVDAAALSAWCATQNTAVGK